MTERKRLLTLLKGEKPDRVPWLGDLAYWYPSALENGLIDKKYAGDGLFDLHRDLGVGFYLQGYFPFAQKTDETIQITRTHSGNEHLTEWTTPVGSLRQLDVYLPESYTSAIKEHCIKTLDDLKTFVYIQEHTAYTPSYAEAERRYRLAGDNGVVLCYLPKSPYMELVALQAGIESVVDMMMEDDEAFEALLAALEIRTDCAAQIALDSPAECLMLPENITSEVVGKGPFNRFMHTYHSKWHARIRAAGKVSFVHLDGTMRGLIRELSEAGARVLEALTPAPVGDIEIEDIQAHVCDHTIIWGGIPGIYFTDLISDAQFDEFVRRVLDTMTTAPRYVLGVADQIPPGSRVERIARVRTLVDQYGQY